MGWARTKFGILSPRTCGAEGETRWITRTSHRTSHIRASSWDVDNKEGRKGTNNVLRVLDARYPAERSKGCIALGSFSIMATECPASCSFSTL